MRSIVLLVTLAVAAPISAQAEPGGASGSLRQQVAAALSTAPVGTRFGLLVVDDQGREVIAINPDQRFIPASNTKLFTTALALDALGRDSLSDTRGDTRFSLIDTGRGSPDLVISGGGGVSLSTDPSCLQRCLAPFVAKVAGATRRVHDVIVDDRAFFDQRWNPGMSWNNIPTASGTAASAVIVDDNQQLLTVTPGAAGKPPAITLSRYFTLRNEAVTGPAGGAATIAFAREPNRREVRVFGSIPAGSAPWRAQLGVDDPADYAAWAMQQALQQSGVTIRGAVRILRRPVTAPDTSGNLAPPLTGPVRVSWAEPAVPLGEAVTTINKISQNLHAEVLLRRVGLAVTSNPNDTPADAPPPGTREAGIAALNAMLGRIGIARTSFDFADGSGMSSYNRVSPVATVALLRWAARQPWSAQWRASLPVGGVDGTLRRRFAGTALQGRIFAKTGTLNATNALSGYLIAASGRELTFAAFANDVPCDVSATSAIDAELQVIARSN